MIQTVAKEGAGSQPASLVVMDQCTLSFITASGLSALATVLELDQHLI